MPFITLIDRRVEKNIFNRIKITPFQGEKKSPVRFKQQHQKNGKKPIQTQKSIVNY